MSRRGLTTAIVTVLFGMVAPAIAQAAGPTAIGVDSEGVVYTGFAAGGEIQRNDGRHGDRLAPWGVEGTAPGEIDGPVVAIDVAPGSGGNVWVLDGGPRVQEFTRGGEFVRGFELGACTDPIDPLYVGGLDVGNRSIFVAHPCADVIYRFDRGTLELKAVVGGFAGVAGLSAQLYDSAPDATHRLYAARPLQHEILEFDRRTLQPIARRAEPGRPTDLFVDAFGVLFVADAARDVIRLYDSRGRLFRTLGRPGGSGGDLVHPSAIDVFDQYSEFAGNPFLADYGNARVQRWNSYGFTFWSRLANGPGGTLEPPPGDRDDGGTPGEGGGDAGPGGAEDPGDQSTRVLAPPRSAVRPQISGEATAGGQLTCGEGEWSGEPDSFRWVWRRNGARIAVGQTYSVVAIDSGRALTCEVVASNRLGSGRSESAQIRISGRAGPPPRVGVSLVDGPYSTRRSVLLRIVPPQGAHAVLIANAPGFADSRQFLLAPGLRYRWDLDPSMGRKGSVFIRFVGEGLDETRTFSARAIVDSRQPRLRSARLHDARGPRGAVLGLKATDRGASGLRMVEFRADRNRGRIRTERFRRYVNLGTAKHARWARVVDRAGNRSAWRPVRGA